MDRDGANLDDVIDAAIDEDCAEHGYIARWWYTLDTSDDDNFPHVSNGLVVLRADGVCIQRVFHSHPARFAPWHGGIGRTYATAEEVEDSYSYPDSNYELRRLP